MFKRLSSLIRAIVGRDRFEATMSEEQRFHMEAYARELVASGVRSEDAWRRARLEFGGTERVKEECRQARGLGWIDQARQDIRYALRQLRRTPGFTVTAILSLALGIGASTAIFVLVDAVLLRNVSLPQPHELFFVGRDPGPRVSTSSNFPLFERYQQIDAFAGVTATWPGGPATFRVSTGSSVEEVPGLFASGNYHATLEVPMALGRGFTNEPDRDPTSGLIAVISDGYWARRFNRSPDAIGQALIVSGRSFTIVGVTAPAFTGLAPGRSSDITLPLSARAFEDPEFFDAHDGWLSLAIVARLKTGITRAQATAAVDAVFQQFMQEPENVWARENLAPEFKGIVFKEATLLPAARGASTLRNQYGTPLAMLMAMVALVLLIACANVANLLFARGTERTREIAVRLSIGASRGRLVRQFLTESLMLAVAGTLAGFALAMWASDAIASVFVIGSNPLRLDLSPGLLVFAFAAVLCLVSTLVFGVVPALKSTRVDLTPALKDAGVPFSVRSRRPALGRALVVAQVALSMLLVAAAALLGRSLEKLRTFDAGFNRSNVLLFTVTTPDETFTADRRRTFYDELMTRLRTRPGVAAVAYATRSPLDNSAQSRRFTVPGGLQPRGVGVSSNVVTPGYFETFGIPVVGGRALTDDDTAAGQKVGVISTETIRTFFGDVDPIGRTVVLGADQAPITVVGVVRDVLHERLRGEAPPMIFTPLSQATFGDPLAGPASSLTVALRTQDDPAILQGAIVSEARALNKDALVSYVRTLEQQVDATLGQERVLSVLSTGFALLALILAAVGLFGVMSYNIARRTREFGIRLALGARRHFIMRSVLFDTLLIAVMGIASGAGAAGLAGQVLSSFLFDLSPHDPLTLALAGSVLLFTTMAAGALPAWRAAATDPVRALRTE
jgi:predicted permease